MDKRFGTKMISGLLCLIMLLAFTACQEGKANQTENPSAPAATPTVDPAKQDDNNTVDALITEDGIRFTKFDQTATWDDTAISIALNNDSISASGDGIVVDGTTVTIQKSGSYILSGTLQDGQIIVEVTKEEKVQLVLNGVDITSLNSAPIYIKSADKVSVTLAEGTVNKLTDGLNYTYSSPADDEPNACLFSKDDLTINGTGALQVVGNFNNGIASKNDLRIVSGTIEVTALNNGLKGKDSVAILNGNIIIDADGDGIKADNEEEKENGYVYILDGNITIDAADDGIQGITAVTVRGGTIKIDAGDKQIACKGDKVIDVQIGS